MAKTDKFLRIGYASEAIQAGDRLELLPSTGLVRKERNPGYDTFVTINADGSMSEKHVPILEKDEDDGDKKF